jgi:hypothetical protein
MSDTLSFTHDPRRRNLLTLAVVAVAMVAFAIVALLRQADEVAPRYQPKSFLPGLATQVHDVAHIHIASNAGTVDVQFKPEKGWVVANHDDYPASFDRVRETLVGLAALQSIEPKTARGDWLHYLGLDPPPKGNGVSITLQNGQGRTLAGVITGKTVDIGDSSGAVGLFVRRTDSDQSWLARSVFQPKTDVGQWLDKQVMDVDLAQIQEVDVNPASGPSFEIRRDKPNVADLAIVDLPKGRELSYTGSADAIAGAVSGFTFDDVRPAREFDFSDSAHVARTVTHTFGGLVVTLHTIQRGQDYWTTVSADAEPGKPHAQQQARTIDARASGWAYKLPIYKGRQLMNTLEDLLKPLPANPAKTGK